MKIARVTIEGVSPYSQSKHHNVDKLPRELPKAYEERTWRERMHVEEDGRVFIPGTSLKNALAEAAKYLSIQIPGQGKATYTKNFEAGVMVIDPIRLPYKKDEVAGEWLFVPSDGKRGGGKRVDKCFPVIHKWGGVAEYIIFDEIITEDVFKRVVEASGALIGIGRFRPRNNGYYGRFKITKLEFGDYMA